ncbi:MAG: hypothetical protein AAB152_09920 [Candidatus Coatesbacteria bacterium]
MDHAARPGGLFAAVAVALWASGAFGSGTWNTREGVYTEEFEDTAGLDLIQAVSVNSVNTSIGVTTGWTWAQPGPSATYLTDTLFSVAGTATTFVQVATATPYGEALELFQRFYSATDTMEWENDCLPPVSTANPRCLLYPISAQGAEVLHGAKSRQVLLVPDVAGFNRCQSDKTCQGSGDYVMAALYVYQDANRDLLLPGHPYNATWWLRSPGMHPNPPPTSGAYNDRLAGFVISYTYTTNGTIRTDYFGGADAGCSEKDPIIGCLERSRGCPLHLRLSDPPTEGGTATLYLNTPGVPSQAPYTPYSFSFVPGSTRGAGSPWDAKDCGEDLLGGMNIGLCHEPPGGTWGFFLSTTGTSSPPNSNDAGSSCGTPAIPCTNSRAAASLFIDGLSITAGAGAYLSPAFDSLSDKTQWMTVAWNVDLNPDAKGVRTPVSLGWRVANTTTGFGFSNTTFDASILPVNEADEYVMPPAMGRYFQYRADFSSWSIDLSPGNPPPPAPFPPPPGGLYDTWGSCLHSGMSYDGSLLPRVRQFRVAYQPDAGQCVSKPITPGRLWRWGRLNYQKGDPAPGRIVCDVLDGGGGIILANVPDGGSLAGIDPGRYPSIRVRFMMYRNGAPVDPRVYWFKVSYTPLQGCLALNRNTVRMSYGEDVAIRFCTNRTGLVDVTVHDAAGQLVKRLFHGELRAGDICQKRWNGTSDPGGHAPTSCSDSNTNPQGVAAAPGLYFVTVMTPAGRETARLAVSR